MGAKLVFALFGSAEHGDLSSVASVDPPDVASPPRSSAPSAGCGMPATCRAPRATPDPPRPLLEPVRARRDLTVHVAFSVSSDHLMPLMPLPNETTVSDDAPTAASHDTGDAALADADTAAVVVDDVVAPEDVVAAAVVAADRADAPVSEITERFLKVVLAHVPLARIEELHLFSPLRQGGVETGIAVIAARVPVMAFELSPAPELPFDDAVIATDEAVGDVAAALAVEADVEADVDADIDADVDADIEADVEADVDVVVDADFDVVVDAVVDAVVDVAIDADVDVGVDADVDVLVDADVDVVIDADVAADVADEGLIETAPLPRIRHTVYTARYRLVQKGPERGKWEADVVAEADAPLVTVDLVVRGVQRRAGEESEIVRYSAPQLARALRVPYPAV
jgi:hypothetical protein